MTRRRSGRFNRRGGTAGLVNEYIGNDMIFPGHTGYTSRTTAPPGWLAANGAAISRTVYASLFTAIGTTYGAGDGATTFNLPDMRGEFVRGWDNGRGVDSGRALGSVQKGTLAAFDDGGSDAVMGLYATGATSADKAVNLGMDVLAGTTDYQAASTNYVVKGGTGGGLIGQAGISRPRNLAQLAIIKY